MLTHEGRCEAHQLQRPTAAARGYTPAWQRYARAFLADHPLCHYCALHGRVTAARCVDHAVPPSRGGAFWDTENHRPACIPCNSRKGNKTEAEYLNRHQ